MTDTVLITGCAGLVGSECVNLFAERGYRVLGVDDFSRGDYFGDEGSTHGVLEQVNHNQFEHHEIDILDDELRSLVQECDAVIHAAAQPSHPYSIQDPRTDFRVNLRGTFNLLEILREEASSVPFVFCSTNKVYGEMPNFFSYRELDMRFEPRDPKLHDGFDESLRLDQNKHTPFGVSKAGADLYVQEYARLYELPAGVFRMGCITGSAARSVEQHNWEPFFVKKALREEPLTIFGYGGKQVRDVIHARDLADLFYRYVQDPQPAGVYNVGGGRANSISLLEAIELIERLTGREMEYHFGPVREADHKWWITDISKVQSDYQDWQLTASVEDIFEEIVKALGDSDG